MNRKQRNALDEIANFINWYTSDDERRDDLFKAACDYVEQDHVLQNEDSISIVWSIDDVKDVRPDLDDEQAMEVLGFVKDKHDATIGITWDTLEYAADHLYPEEVLP